MSTKRQRIREGKRRMRTMPYLRMLCRDCEVDTGSQGVDEYFMVHNYLWKIVAPELDDHYCGESWGWGFLCVGCLEHRLGRLLTRADFTSAPCNGDHGRSARLQNRRRGLRVRTVEQMEARFRATFSVNPP